MNKQLYVNHWGSPVEVRTVDTKKDTPINAGQVWHIKTLGENEVRTVRIGEITEKTIVFEEGDSLEKFGISDCSYKTRYSLFDGSIQFVEQVCRASIVSKVQYPLSVTINTDGITSWPCTTCWNGLDMEAELSLCFQYEFHDLDPSQPREYIRGAVNAQLLYDRVYAGWCVSPPMDITLTIKKPYKEVAAAFEGIHYQELIALVWHTDSK